jgi:hypothetical protein
MPRLSSKSYKTSNKFSFASPSFEKKIKSEQQNNNSKFSDINHITKTNSKVIFAAK